MNIAEAIFMSVGLICLAVIMVVMMLTMGDLHITISDTKKKEDKKVSNSKVEE